MHKRKNYRLANENLDSDDGERREPVVVRIKRPLLIVELFRRARRFVSKKWHRLGWGDSKRLSRLFTYCLGAATTVYSIVDLCFELNIEPLMVTKLPFFDFFRLELVPFLSIPLTWTGFEFGTLYESLVAPSAIGASIWVNAEFRENTYMTLYPFLALQRRPGPYFDPDALRSPPKPSKRTSLISLKSIARIPEGFLLSHSMLGLAAFAVGFVWGIARLLAYAYELLLFFAGSAIFIVQHFLAPLERWGHDDYWGTRFFLAVYDFRAWFDHRLEERLERSRLLRIGEWPLGRLLRDIAEDTARITALATATFLAILPYLAGLVE